MCWVPFSPLGHEAFVARQLQRKRADQDRLLERIPTLDDLQAAWLLLQSCAAPRANYLLRILPPHLTADYAAAHDASVTRCLAALLEQGETPLPPTGERAAQLAQRFGGLGLRSAVADSAAAHWASWQDTLPVIRARAPGSRRTTPSSLARGSCSPLYCRRSRGARATAARPATTPRVGMPKALARLHQMCNDRVKDSGPWPFKGWQRLAARACEERAFETHLSELSPASRALLLSQAGPFAARAHQCPAHPPGRHDPQRPVPRAPAAAPAHAPAARAAQMRLPMGSLIPWAITVPPAPPQGSCRRAPCPSSMQSRASVVKPARGSPVTSGWPT